MRMILFLIPYSYLIQISRKRSRQRTSPLISNKSPKQQNFQKRNLQIVGIGV